MEFEMASNSLKVCSKVFDKKSEYPVDCEFTLPDYCPDVERILKCNIIPRVTNIISLTDTVGAEITASICVLYVTSENKLFGYEMPVNLSKTISTGTLQQDTIKSYSTKTEYVNCRAVNNRKIDVHGSVSLFLKLLMREDSDFISDVVDDSVVLKKQQTRILEVCGHADKQINITDDITLSNSGGSVSNIIRYDVCAVADEVKTIANRVIIKVNVMFELLYLSTDMRYETIKHTIPVNQVVDVDGVQEESVCNVKIDVCTASLKPLTNEDGEMRSINAQAKVNIGIVAYKNNEVCLVTDGYSTKYECSLEKKSIDTRRFVKSINERCTVSETAEISSKIAQIIDLKCVTQSLSHKNESDCLMLTGDIAVGIVLIDDEGACQYYEKIMPFETRVNIDSNYRDCVPEFAVNIVDSSCNISSEAVEIKCELNIFGIVTQGLNHQIVTDIVIDETKEKQWEDMPSLVVYYGNTGESLWDIAIRYNSSVEKIAAANSIEEDTLLKNTMLLIPSI